MFSVNPSENSQVSFRPCISVFTLDFIIDMPRFIGNRFPHRRIIVAIAFMLPAMMGNILLWKSRRDNKSALLAGLYIVCFFSTINLWCAFTEFYQRKRANIEY
jgi:hypothetical protein